MATVLVPGKLDKPNASQMSLYSIQDVVAKETSYMWDEFRRNELPSLSLQESGPVSRTGQEPVHVQIMQKMAVHLRHASVESLATLLMHRGILSAKERALYLQPVWPAGTSKQEHLSYVLIDRAKLPVTADQCFQALYLSLRDSYEEASSIPTNNHYIIAQLLLDEAKTCIKCEDSYTDSFSELRAAIERIPQSESDFDQTKAARLVQNLGFLSPTKFTSYQQICLHWLDIGGVKCTMGHLVLALVKSGLGKLTSGLQPVYRSNPPRFQNFVMNLSAVGHTASYNWKSLAYFLGYKDTDPEVYYVDKHCPLPELKPRMFLRVFRLPDCEQEMESVVSEISSGVIKQRITTENKQNNDNQVQKKFAPSTQPSKSPPPWPLRPTSQNKKESPQNHPPPPSYSVRVSLLDTCMIGNDWQLVDTILDSMQLLGEELHSDEGKTAFHYVCRDGNIVRVRRMIAKGAKVTQIDKSGQSVLHYNAVFKNEQLLKILLIDFKNKGVSVDVCDKESFLTPLMMVCTIGDDAYGSAKLLLDYGANPNGNPNAHSTPLIVACQGTHDTFELVELLVERGADINKQDKDGYTLLLKACTCRKWNVAKYVLGLPHLTTINRSDRAGTTPLFEAVSQNNPEMVELLLSKGARTTDVRLQTNNVPSLGSRSVEETPFVHACRHGMLEIAKLLVKYNVDVNYKCSGSIPAIVFALVNHKNNIVHYLLHDCEKLDTTIYGLSTPIVYSVKVGNDQCTKWMLDKLGGVERAVEEAEKIGMSDLLQHIDQYRMTSLTKGYEGSLTTHQSHDTVDMGLAAHGDQIEETLYQFSKICMMVVKSKIDLSDLASITSADNPHVPEIGNFFERCAHGFQEENSFKMDFIGPHKDVSPLAYVVQQGCLSRQEFMHHAELYFKGSSEAQKFVNRLVHTFHSISGDTDSVSWNGDIVLEGLFIGQFSLSSIRGQPTYDLGGRMPPQTPLEHRQAISWTPPMLRGPTNQATVQKSRSADSESPDTIRKARNEGFQGAAVDQHWDITAQHQASASTLPSSSSLLPVHSITYDSEREQSAELKSGNSSLASPDIVCKTFPSEPRYNSKPSSQNKPTTAAYSQASNMSPERFRQTRTVTPPLPSTSHETHDLETANVADSTLSGRSTPTLACDLDSEVSEAGTDYTEVQSLNVDSDSEQSLGSGTESLSLSDAGTVDTHTSLHADRSYSWELQTTRERSYPAAAMTAQGSRSADVKPRDEDFQWPAVDKSPHQTSAEPLPSSTSHETSVHSSTSGHEPEGAELNSEPSEPSLQNRPMITVQPVHTEDDNTSPERLRQSTTTPSTERQEATSTRSSLASYEAIASVTFNDSPHEPETRDNESDLSLLSIGESDSTADVEDADEIIPAKEMPSLANTKSIPQINIYGFNDLSISTSDSHHAKLDSNSLHGHDIIRNKINLDIILNEANVFQMIRHDFVPKNSLPAGIITLNLEEEKLAHGSKKTGTKQKQEMKLDTEKARELQSTYDVKKLPQPEQHQNFRQSESISAQLTGESSQSVIDYSTLTDAESGSTIQSDCDSSELPSPLVHVQNEPIRGCGIINQINLTITNEANCFRSQMNRNGFSLSVPKDSLPAGLTSAKLTIHVCASGPFELPSECHLVSAVYWIKPDPPCEFTKPLTMKLEHCAAITDDKQLSCLTFVRAHCTQPTLPYTFKEKKGGTFTSNHGVIELTSFSGYGITSTPPPPQESLEEGGQSALESDVQISRPGVRCGVWKFSTKFHSNQWQVRVIIAWMLAIVKEIVEKPPSDQPKSEYDFDMVLSANTKTLCIPSDTIENGDWELSPCHKPVISYSEILQCNNKDSRLPGFYISVLWKGSGPPQGVFDKRIYFTGDYKDDFFQVIINPEVKYRFHPSVDPISAQFLGPSTHDVAVAGHAFRQDSSGSRSANPTPRESVNEPRLEVDAHLSVVRNAIWDARDKWFDIGVELGVAYATLSNIDSEGRDNGECLRKMLVEWLKRTGEATPRWSGLVDALKKPSVGFEELSRDIADKHVHVLST